MSEDDGYRKFGVGDVDLFKHFNNPKMQERERLFGAICEMDIC